ncbi:hypothetical protein [Oscillibacter sp.]|uniref:hypothetical protein n=1 Tax=Oscillibacter sp. TaxID=1945593 RepID=UPI0028990D8C|nr:hypothetical protein [Oscillibacter sp.]
MKRTLRAALLAGATVLGCTVVAWGYWIDSIQVKTDVTVFYPAEITVIQPEKVPIPEEIPQKKTPLEGALPDGTDPKSPSQGEEGSDTGEVKDPANAQTPSQEKTGSETEEEPAPGASAELVSRADPGESAPADSPAAPTGGAASGSASDAGDSSSGEPFPASGTDGGAHEGASD